MTSVANKWISVADASAYAGVDEVLILSWLTEGDLTGRHSRDGWKIHVNTFEKWLTSKGLRENFDKNSNPGQVVRKDMISPSSTQLSPPVLVQDEVSRMPLFARAVMKEAILILPSLPNSSSMSEQKEFLRTNLHYNSIQTRDRFSAYILKHIFPSGEPDLPLLEFAKKFPDTKSLKDVCFYRFLESQPLMRLVVENVLLPAIGQGLVSKARIYQYLESKFPLAKPESLKSTVAAICEALVACSIAQVDKQNIRFSLRDIEIEGFAFILHSEFFEPDTYNLDRLQANKTFQALLWNSEKVIPALYELRNRGIITKISNIDSLRQFTTFAHLTHVVELLRPLRIIA